MVTTLRLRRLNGNCPVWDSSDRRNCECPCSARVIRQDIQDRGCRRSHCGLDRIRIVQRNDRRQNNAWLEHLDHRSSLTKTRKPLSRGHDPPIAYASSQPSKQPGQPVLEYHVGKSPGKALMVMSYAECRTRSMGLSPCATEDCAD